MGRLWWEVFSTNYREPIKNSLGRAELALVEGRDEIIVDHSSFHPLLQGGNSSFLCMGNRTFIHGKAAQKGLRWVQGDGMEVGQFW